MNSARKTEGWVLCPSKSFAGKYYYFNVTTGETAWSLNEDERKLLKSPVLHKDKHSYPEPSGPPLDDTPSIFTQHSYRTVNSTNRNICVDVRTYQQPVFGQPAFMIPDIQIKVPMMIGSEFRNCAPTFASINQSCLPIEEGKMTFRNNLTEVDRDLFIPTTYTPLGQRFVNYEEPNARRYVSYQESDNKVEQLTGFVNKAEQLTSRFVTEQPLDKEHQPYLARRFVNEQPLDEVEQSTLRFDNEEPLNKAEQLKQRFVNKDLIREVEESTPRYVIEESVNKVEQLTSRYVNQELVNKSSALKDHQQYITRKFVDKFEQQTPRNVIKEPFNKVEQSTLRFDNEEPVNKVEQLTSRFFNKEPLHDEQSTSRFIVEAPQNKVEQLTSLYANQEQFVNKSSAFKDHQQYITRRFVSEEPHDKVEQQIRHVIKEPLSVEQLTSTYVNKQPLNRVERLTSRFVDTEQSPKDVKFNTLTPSKAVKSLYIYEKSPKLQSSTPIKNSTPLFPHDQSSIENIRQMDKNMGHQTKLVIREPVLNLVPKSDNNQNVGDSNVSKLELSNIPENSKVYTRTVFGKNSNMKAPAKENTVFQSRDMFSNKRNTQNDIENPGTVPDVEKPTLLPKDKDHSSLVNTASDKNYICHSQTHKQKSTLTQRKLIEYPTNEESELLKDLSANDLRRILMANRKRKMVDMDKPKTVEEKKIRITKEGNQTSTAPKKKVTFNLVPEQLSDVSSTVDSTPYNEEYTFNEDVVQELKLLASPSKRANPWYIVVDTQVLLEELEFLESFTKHDPKCHIFIASSVMSDIIHLTRSDSAGRHHVTLARHLMRRLWKPHPQIIAPISTDDNDDMTTEEAILKTCTLAMKEHSLVILITNDENLLAKARHLKIHSFNIQQIKDGGFGHPEVSFDIKKIMISVPNVHDLSNCEIPAHTYKMKLFENNKEINNNKAINQNCSQSSPYIDKVEYNNGQNQNPFESQKESFEIQINPTKIPATYQIENRNTIASNDIESHCFRNDENQQKIEENNAEKDIVSTYFQTEDRNANQSLASLFKRAKENALKKKREKLSSATVLNVPKKSIEIDGIERIEIDTKQKKPSIFENANASCSEFENYKNIEVRFNNSLAKKDESTKVLAMTSDFFGGTNIDDDNEENRKIEDTKTAFDSIFEDLPTKDTPMTPDKYKHITKSTNENDRCTGFLNEILEKNNVTEKRIEDRKEEVMCSLMQILEECLTDILKNSSIHKSPLPWSLPEALQYADKVYGSHTTIKSALDFMGSVFNDKGKVKRSVLDASGGINARDVVNFIGSGYLLLDCLKKIHPNSETLIEAEDSLNKILQNDPNSIVEQVVKTPVLSRNVVSYEDKCLRRNFVKKRSEVINYLTKHYPAWAGFDETLNTGNMPSWGQTNKDVTIVRTFGKNLNLLNINKSKRMTITSDNSKINNYTEEPKIAPNNMQSSAIGNNNDMTGPIVKTIEEITKHLMSNKVPEQKESTNATDKSKTADNVICKNMNEKLAQLKLTKDTESINIKDHSNKEETNSNKTGPKIIRPFEKLKLNRGIKNVNMQNIEGSKSSNDLIMNEINYSNAIMKNDPKTESQLNFKMTKIKNFNITNMDQNIQKNDENQQEFVPQSTIKDTRSSLKKTDVKIIRQIDNINPANVKDSVHKIFENLQNFGKADAYNSHNLAEKALIDLKKPEPKISKPLTNQGSSKFDENFENPKEKRLDNNKFMALQKNIPIIVKSFNNSELNKEKCNKTVDNVQKTTPQKQNDVQNVEETKERDIQKTVPKIVRLIGNKEQNVINDNNVRERENNTDLDIDFPSKGHTFGVNDNAGPKVIRNLQFIKEYEDKIKDRRLSTDLDALDYDYSEDVDDSYASNNNLDATNDTTIKTEPVEVNRNIGIANNFSSSTMLGNHVTSASATNDMNICIQNLQKGLIEAAHDRNSQGEGKIGKNDATNDLNNYTQNRERQKGLNEAAFGRNYSQQSVNKIDATNDFNNCNMQNQKGLNDAAGERNLLKGSSNIGKIDATNDNIQIREHQKKLNESIKERNYSQEVESKIGKIDATDDFKYYKYNDTIQRDKTRNDKHNRKNDIYNLKCKENKNDAINDFESFATCQATNDTSINDFESCLTNVSSASYTRQKTNENDSDSINDESEQKYDTTLDSYGDDSRKICLTFLTKLSNVLMLAESFVQSCTNEVRDKHLPDNQSNRIYEKASIVYKSVTKIIDSLKSIILRECCKATSLSLALALATGDERMRDYRLVVSNFLVRAQLLMSNLKVLLSQCESNIDNTDSFLTSSRHFSVFE